MDAVLQLFAVHYHYEDPLERRTAEALALLNAVAMALALCLALGVFLTWRGRLDSEAVLLIVLLVTPAIVMRILIDHGRLTAAVNVAVGYSLAAALVLTLYYGLNTPAPLTLAVPVLVAGLVLDRRGITITTLVALVGLIGMGLIDSVLIRRLPSFWMGTLPLALLIGAYGAAQWMLGGEFRTLFRQLRDVEDKLQTTFALSADVIRQADLDTIMTEFGALMHSAFALQQVLIYLQDADNPSILRLRSATGLAAQRAMVEGRRISTQADLPVAQTFRDRQPIRVRATDLASLRVGFLPGTNAELILPLQFGDTVFGVVDLQSADVEVFTPQTVELLTVLTRQFSTNVQTRDLSDRLEAYMAEQERLYAHLQRDAQEIQQLRRQAAGIVWGRFFRERGTDIIGFDLDPATGSAIPGETLPPSLQETLQAGKVNVQPTETGYRLSLPIIVRGQVLGAMDFDITRGGDLPPNLIDLASTIADRLSLALDNVRLVEETQAFAFREQQVSSISTRLQGTSSLEELLALAAEEFNEALGGSRTQIRLQSYDRPLAQTGPEPSTHRGGAS